LDLSSLPLPLCLRCFSLLAESLRTLVILSFVAGSQVQSAPLRLFDSYLALCLQLSGFLSPSVLVLAPKTVSLEGLMISADHVEFKCMFVFVSLQGTDSLSTKCVSVHFTSSNFDFLLIFSSLYCFSPEYSPCDEVQHFSLVLIFR
jgi:hypothetical protein